MSSYTEYWRQENNSPGNQHAGWSDYIVWHASGMGVIKELYLLFHLDIYCRQLIRAATLLLLTVMFGRNCVDDSGGHVIVIAFAPPERGNPRVGA